ncbi:putative nucleotide-diphospho-sugar transferase [Neorhizobium alkalisoli]|uniref:Nucleotide-diphospho-sugar transferase n=1 Tax=Neorhizobium alkalisoli TaxID=528178 RepID=A0A561R3F7_9HYPH|nr:putative nucleotide-diphospho-sugar transferase [Neorhizobium alkalisoli]TWF57155.1 nucleotide-diphospho-sugar transferase [Neorhizobium alkalisoli]
MAHILLCGMSNAGSDILFDLLKEFATNATFVDKGMAASELYKSSKAHVVSERPLDILPLRRFRESVKETISVRPIVMMKDIRAVMTETSDRYPNVYQTGYDHSLMDYGQGRVAYSNPGILFTEKVISNFHKNDQDVLVLRFEDLLIEPSETRKKIEKFTGLNIGSEFIQAVDIIRAQTLSAGSAWFSDRHADRVVRQFRLAPELFEILDRWGYGTDRLWFDALASRAPNALNDLPGTIVGFYTAGTRYEREAQRLAASVQKLGLPLDLEAIEPGQGWLDNVRAKPHVLKRIRQRLRGPLFYVDVDAILHSDPWPYLRGYGGDAVIGTHVAGEVLSGSLLLHDTAGAHELLDQWIVEQQRQPEAWDQHALKAVVHRSYREKSVNKLDIQYLPASMIAIFDQTYNPPITPVVEHLQASREEKQEGEQGRQNAERRRARVEAIENELGLAPISSPVVAEMPSYAQQAASIRNAATTALMEKRASDHTRWANEQNLHSDWSERAAVAATMIGGSSPVIDLGCGKMNLEAFLPEGALYLPADLVPRDERTLKCDLNEGILPDRFAAVVVMLGVLEYVHEPPILFERLAKRWSRLVMSYNPADLDHARDRRAQGWFNDLTSAQLVTMAAAAGFELYVECPVGERQRIYDFRLNQA